VNTSAEVILWGTRIGIVHQDPGKPYASFEYDERFLQSGIELSPLKMPLSDVVYEFPLLSGEPFFGMPGLVADSLPDSFGNKVIEHWLHSKGKTIKDFTSIDRLCYTGKRGMGALEYAPVIPEMSDIDHDIDVSEMVRFASDILSGRESVVLNAEDSLTYSQLVRVGSSAGGARAKALIAWNEKTNEIRSGQISLGKDFDYWLMKFDNVTKNGDHGLLDNPEYTLIEYAYYKMAIAAGIEMGECRLFSCEGDNHFLTKRFDRVNGSKIHMQSLSALAHISYKEPGLCSYETAVQYMRELKLTEREIEQFYCRMVFNCLAVNQDDHVKNISFLMDRKGVWRLSPAYDLTYSYDSTNKWLCAHQMTVNGKSRGITLSDLTEAGLKMGLKRKKCVEFISRVSTVVSDFEKYAEQTGIRESTAHGIKKILDQNKVEL